MADINLIEEKTREAMSSAGTALSTVQVFRQGKAAGIELSAAQKATLRSRYIVEMTECRDAAQEALNELGA